MNNTFTNICIFLLHSWAVPSPLKSIDFIVSHAWLWSSHQMMEDASNALKNHEQGWLQGSFMLLFCWLIVLVWQFTWRDKEPWQRSKFSNSSHCLQPIKAFEIIELNQKHSLNENDFRIYPEETHADLLWVLSLYISKKADSVQVLHISTFPKSATFAKSVLTVWRKKCVGTICWRYNFIYRNRERWWGNIICLTQTQVTHVSIKAQNFQSICQKWGLRSDKQHTFEVFVALHINIKLSLFEYEMLTKVSDSSHLH